MLKKNKIKISKINIENDIFSILSHNNEIFNADIIKGSVRFKIYNENKDEIYLNGIEEGDIITVYSTSDKNKNINNIIKIKMQNKYILNSDSSEEIIDNDNIIN
jgi:hypothetical protein